MILNRLFPLLICLFCTQFCFAQKQPKLVIGITVDQMRWDYLYKYASRYGEQGFKRLLREGFSFENAMIPYTPTVTAAGHACLFTGSVPALSGMVGNDWYERDSNRVIYCTEDKSVRTLGSFTRAGEMSPRNLFATTIGDELKLSNNFKSRVFGIALKDRGGILPAGHAADAAYWFDDSTGNWISSSYYFSKLPGWVEQFNSIRKPDSLIAAGWKLDYSSYSLSIMNNPAYRRSISVDTGKSDHYYTTKGGTYYYAMRVSPAGNSFTADFAKQLIENERLGNTAATDMLCLSFSATDYVGHFYGPQSREIEHTYIEMDKVIADLLQYLDGRIGKNNYLLFLSADHGAPYSPGYMRDSLRIGGNQSTGTTFRALNAAGLQRFGIDKLITSTIEYQVYLDHRKLDSAKIPLSDALNFFKKELLKMPAVTHAFSYAEIANEPLPAAVKERFVNGLFPRRSGDLQFILRSQYTDGPAAGTDHGSVYPYDAHIPMLFFGTNIPKGKSHREVYMNDLAPTVCALLNIQMPGAATGKVLTEVTDR